MTKLLLSIAAFCFCLSAHAGFPAQFNLEFTTKNPVTGPNQPELMLNTLVTLPETAHNLNRHGDVIRLLDDVDGRHGRSKIYAYRIVTPNHGSGFEQTIHPLFAKQIMDGIGCSTREHHRKIVTIAELLFGLAEVDALATRAANAERFFNSLAHETRRLANYDGTKNDIPYYEPRFRVPGHAVGFKCHVLNGHDEDGVALTDVYTGMFIGDFNDYSLEAGGNPQTGVAGKAKLGYLVLSMQ
jgi:hypothetical protein